MRFHQIKNYTRFTIESEPESLFYKESERYDGAINAYKIKDENENKMLKPVTFSRDYKIEVTK